MGYTPHVLVVGGGVVGTGIARDLALRGLEVTLVEQGPLTAGATGRTQGVLYSGARVARSDPDVARRRLAENRVLRDIAGHCMDDTDGLFVSNGDSEAFDALVAACRECGIDGGELSGDEARALEPGLSPEVERALRVPEAAVDPFRVTVANAKGAQEYGADIRPHTTVTDVLVEDGAVVGVDVRHEPPQADAENSRRDGDGDDDGGSDDEDANDDENDGGATSYPGVDVSSLPMGAPGDSPEAEELAVTEEEIRADYVVNAAGGWARDVAAMAGLTVPLEYTKGTVAVLRGVDVETVVTGYRTGETQTVVPQRETCLLGTTDAPANGPDDTGGEPTEVERLFANLSDLVPSLSDARPLRTYRGVRATDSPAEESGFAVVDHGERDDRWGMTTVVGGTFTTHRLVAERVSDQVCLEFGIVRDCLTDEVPLPGHDQQGKLDGAMDEFDVRSPLSDRGRNRPGGRGSIPEHETGVDPIVCECEGVTRAEIRDALEDDTTTPTDLDDVRVRTWATMGECQGGRCVHRIAAELHPEYDADISVGALADLLAERWKGQRDALWGENLAEAMRTYAFHAGTANRAAPRESVEIEAFDDGPDWDETGPDVTGGLLL